MSLPWIFDASETQKILQRIDRLSPESQPLWGKMNAAQMLAHCCVTYEMLFTEKHKRPNTVIRLLLKLFVKNTVVSEKPYPQNSRTAPAFLISDAREFAQEKARLSSYIQQVQNLGSPYFEGKESLSFGKLTAREWNNLFYKHLDHHLRQFGV